MNGITIKIIAGALCATGIGAAAQSAFQPYSAQGDNLIHVTTADFDGVGAKDYVVAMSVEGKIIAFDRPAEITDPAADNRLWEYQTPCSFNIMIAAADASSGDPGDEVLVPGTDGRLRILSSSGALLHDWTVSSGALYCVGVGVNSAGHVRIVAGGVDGKVYFLDESGTVVGAKTPTYKGNTRRVVVGNFDGIGGDEVMVFYARAGFAGNRYIELYDLDTLARPAYWGATTPIEDDVGPTVDWGYEGMGWTDKQLPWAYDMDGDGDEEVVAHWGVIHPENGASTNLLSALVPRGELLYLQANYRNVYEDTDTGKYLLQQGVPGNFKGGTGYLGTEMFTLYGDDLYLVRYDTTKSVYTNRFRVSDYGYAHTLYHFTDGARLEDRNGGLDKIVLAGPANGDDHFYVVDLSGNQWKADAKTIDGRGVLGAVRDTLDGIRTDIDNFAGTVAAAGEPIWYLDFFGGWTLGWDMAADNIELRANEMLAGVQVWRNMLGGGAPGYLPQRINFTITLNVDGKPKVTPEGLVAYCAALAQRGVHFCLVIGHNSQVFMTPDLVADCFEAAVVDGENFMMARTLELSDTDFIDLFKPHMDALRARAALLGVAPPKVMLCGKGPIFSAMSPSQASTYFPAYKDILVPGVENSNTTTLDWSFSERAGLWLNGDVEDWGCNPIGDNLAANRIAEWGGMNNAHVVLRQMLSQFALGARIFRTTSIIGKDNPLYLRGDTTDPDDAWTDPYKNGILGFLRLVEAGVYPNSPDRGQLKGVSPVAVALHDPDYVRLRMQELRHDHNQYAPQPATYVINSLACWNAYTDVTNVDATAILFNSKRRWDTLFPTSPSGFVALVPYATRAGLEANPWCKRAYETDGDTWAEFGSLSAARDAIAAELVAQRANQLFQVENECFWQITQQKDDPNILFAVLMDSNTLTPTERDVKLKKCGASGTWVVFDQFGSQTEPLGILASAGDEVAIHIPAGSVRILALKRVASGSVVAIGWDGGTVPATVLPGISGTVVPSLQGIRAAASSNDGHFGPDLGFGGAATAVNGAYEVRGAEHSAPKSRVDVAITNNTGSAIGLDALLFDYCRWYTNSPTNIVVIYLSGNLGVGANTTLATFTSSHIGGWNSDYADFSVSLANLDDSTLANGEHAVFRLQASGAIGATTGSGFDNMAITIAATDPYDAWAAGYGLFGSNAWNSADIEPDGMNNLVEYALGGNPAIADAAAILPVLSKVSDPGAGWLEHVHRRRSDYLARSLLYNVEASTNLVSGTWSTNGVTPAGSGPLDAEFDSVTNRIATDAEERFIRLRVLGE